MTRHRYRRLRAAQGQKIRRGRPQSYGERKCIQCPNGKVLGSHYAGPRWEARDGSIAAAARDGGVTVDPTAVDWLRLKVTSTTAGPDGDRLTATTYIQRIHTVGGRPPAAADCDAGSAAEQREIPYSADYVFFKATGN